FLLSDLVRNLVLCRKHQKKMRMFGQLKPIQGTIWLFLSHGIVANMILNRFNLIPRLSPGGEEKSYLRENITELLAKAANRTPNIAIDLSGRIAIKFEP